MKSVAKNQGASDRLPRAQRPDFANDICLLAHRHTAMQVMTVDLTSTAAMLGLKISTNKTKHTRMNHRSDAPIVLHLKVVEESQRVYVPRRTAPHPEHLLAKHYFEH